MPPQPLNNEIIRTGFAKGMIFGVFFSLTGLDAAVLVDVPDNVRVVVGGCLGRCAAPLPPLVVRGRMPIAVGGGAVNHDECALSDVEAFLPPTAAAAAAAAAVVQRAGESPLSLRIG